MGDDGYRILDSELPELRRCVVEQADASDVKPAERLLGQLAALELHSQRRPSAGPLLFRPTAATADLAARAIRALRRNEGVRSDFWVGGEEVTQELREIPALRDRDRQDDKEGSCP